MYYNWMPEQHVLNYVDPFACRFFSIDTLEIFWRFVTILKTPFFHRDYWKNTVHNTYNYKICIN